MRRDANALPALATGAASMNRLGPGVPQGKGLRAATLRQLKAMSLVAHHHSFARAASHLCLTPAAVSLQIKELERAIGLRLFDRKGHAVALTSAGAVLLVDVHRALHALDHADEALSRLLAEPGGAVSIGMVDNATHFIPRMLAQFHDRHRQVELRLSVGNREQLMERMRRGQLDFAVMGTPPRDPQVRAERFASQPLGIIATPQHPLTQQRSIPVAALAGHEFIVREPGSGTRAAMERFFDDGQIEPLRVMEMTGNEAIKQAVMATMGLAFISLHAAAMELDTNLLAVLDVVGLPLARSWFVVHLSATPLADAAQEVRRFIVEYGGGAIAKQLRGSARGLADVPASVPSQ